jgi:hypothetical protein
LEPRPCTDHGLTFYEKVVLPLNYQGLLYNMLRKIVETHVFRELLPPCPTNAEILTSKFPPKNFSARI